MKSDQLSNNDFLSGLDFDNVPDEQKSAILAQMIDNELEKPEGEADETLVNECLAFIEDLNEGRYKKNDRELDAILQKVTSKHLSPPVRKHSFKPIKHSRILRFAAVVAALMVVTFSTVTPTAKVSDTDWLYDHIYEIMYKMEPGRYDYGDLSIIIPRETITYDSIDELLQKTDLVVPYPTVLPEGIEIEHIYQSYYEGDQCNTVFAFNSTYVMYDVQNFDLDRFKVINPTLLDEYESLDINGYQFNLFYSSGELSRYSAYCVTDTYALCVSCPDHDDLISIIQNIKGF